MTALFRRCVVQAKTFFVARLLGTTLLLWLSSAANSAETGHIFNPVPAKPLAPMLKLRDIDGKQIDLARLRGQVVLVNFWATWCPPCQREMPSLERLWQVMNKQKGFKIIAVNIAEDSDTIFSFFGLLEPSPTFPILFDKDGSVLRAWPVKGLPTTFLIDKKGRIAYRAVGGREFDSAASRAIIEKVINEN